MKNHKSWSKMRFIQKEGVNPIRAKQTVYMPHFFLTSAEANLANPFVL